MRTSVPQHASQSATSLGSRLAVAGLAALVLVFGAFALAISQSSLRTLEGHAQSAMRDQEAAMRDMIALFDGTMRTEADRFLTAFADAVPGPYGVDATQTVEVAGKPTPAFKSGDTVMNLNFIVPDKFFARTGGTIATVFARTGDDFVRVTTSLKKESGERAIGTLLDRAHPSYKALMAGESFRGLAWLFGVPYMSKYEPVRDAAGKVVGALYVGVDVRAELALLKDKIRSHGIGRTGGYFVIDGKAGADQGKVLIDRDQGREGKNLLDAKDADGLAWVREMIERKDGMLRHTLADTDGSPARERFTVFTQYPDWKLVIAGTAYVNELEADLVSARNRFLLLGLALGVLLAGGLFWMLRRAVSTPLAEVVSVARRVAAGDLTHRFSATRRDEIGQLMHAINGVGDGLSGIVDKVRASASTIASSTGQIAAGNVDLSARTEAQAGNLERTASSIEQLAATVRQNADSAQHAHDMVQSASQAANAGGQTVERLVGTMSGIHATAQKIADITGIIDGIAFQTNILALNAAVEAARAGEQGRGFAVVAGEVRSLAQRSAAAAKEIKELISRSVQEVQAGNEAARGAGEAMQDIVTRVERIAGIMGEISHASREQSQGIEEVNRAVTSMDEVTQQNAALVEEAAAAAESLRQQAQELRGAVDVFRLA
ncbi:MULTISPECIES: methyl-accepting chemotaxis protein [Ralstonia solanacearum species complex]|uniref:methyl-accepting chemotaxis protein n=1 Tax=Ralstonia solanacearum species complex TaxID=3116862 RepID=UPI000E576282|nr:methyl-accepting chemotaxis protein [Ralstonia solanacearum]BEU70676.1 methyl-accepting chemotaxis protein [Ralstonia pseudosolanacearum]AXV75705.1 methyl-accepting chemotaxis protein [Ralstonia solanacearum]AXV89704.1 methyl-accepting chemotaxis protein [Ralstonia solanacearum]AXW17911.1 methyl-accepting chemotaxis protein [Ralstonia solanacearum]AXW74617.1 methyl-accepting chemotaxis protein [Ralstonia solanacearum]